MKSPEIYPLILEIVPKSPTKYGYIKDGWTIPMIVDYLKRQGIDVSCKYRKKGFKKNGLIYCQNSPSPCPYSIRKKS